MQNGQSFDVTIIGSGPGGYVAAIRAAQMGLRVAVVERDPRGCGGTCLQRGCIPTKALLHTADLFDEMRRAKEFGIVVKELALDFPALMLRKTRIVNRLSKGISSHLFKKNGITLFEGEGRLEGPRAVVVKGPQGEAKIDTRKLIIATGARPKGVPGITIDRKSVLTSDEILELQQMPTSLAVIGAGAVGVEFASIFARLGAAVTLLEMLPRVLPMEDQEISAEARKLLAKHMTIHTDARTEAVLPTAQGVEIAFRTATGEAQHVTAQLLLIAVGRAPVTERLGLQTTRVQVQNGFVRVNSLMETDEPGVYAIGDVVTIDGTPHPQLAHVASHEGIGVAERLAGRSVAPLNYDRIPSATYARPEVAAVGLTEAEATARGHQVKVGRFAFGSLAKPRIIGHEAGFVKVVAESRYDEILGVHMVGPHATDLISEACLALQLEATTESVYRTVHPHPTLSEALMQAAEAVYDHAIDA